MKSWKLGHMRNINFTYYSDSFDLIVLEKGLSLGWLKRYKVGGINFSNLRGDEKTFWYIDFEWVVHAWCITWVKKVTGIKILMRNFLQRILNCMSRER